MAEEAEILRTAINKLYARATRAVTAARHVPAEVQS